MKNKYLFVLVLLMIFTTSFPKDSKLDGSLISSTLSQLKYAVNNKDFSAVSNYLAVDYMYENIKSPISTNILKQVISQFPRIDSILVKNSVFKGERIHLNIKLFAENGITLKEIILDQDYKILKADIANISIAGHGSAEGTYENNYKKESLIKNVMPFWLSETGHIVVEAEVNGKKGNFVVDSGTSGYLMLNTVYDTFDTEKLEIKPLGVSGPINDAGRVIINNFEWNGIEFEEIEAITANLDHLGKNMNISSFAGTIGYGILKNYIIEFDYENNQLILWQNASSIKKKYNIEESQIIPISMAYHIPVIKGRIGNKEIRFGIDCGAQGNMLEQKWKEELINNFSNVRKEELVGAENKEVNSIKALLGNININNNQYEMDFIFGDLFGGAHKVTLLDGLLGYPFLSYQRTAINFKDNELYFLE